MSRSPSRTVPRCRLDEAGDDAQRRRLAAAGGAEQDQELAIGDIERDMSIGGLELAVTLGDAGHSQTGHESHHPADLDEAIGDQHRRRSADLQDGYRRDGRVDLPLEILQDRDRQRGAPGPTRNRLISRLPNEDTKPNSAAATTPGRMAGNVTLRNVVKRLAPRLLRGLLDRSVEPAEARRHQAHRPRDDDQHMAGVSPPSEPRIGSPVAISASTWNT